MQVVSKLYSYEHGQKKFQDFFNNDFTLPKFQKIAGKNAVALIPKKKYHLAIAFFILAKDIKSACLVAVDRCQDPVLAAMMCRLNDPANEKGEITKVIEPWFIKRGEQFNDPYLSSIGNWLNKDFVKAVNVLSPLKEDDKVSKILNNEVAEFNLLTYGAEGAA